MDILAAAPSADDLNDAERQLLRAAATGQLVDLSSGDPALDDPAGAAEWPDERTVRAEFLADLLTGDRDPDGSKLRAVKLRGARITGALDLEALALACPLLLQDCCIDEPVNLKEATAPAVRLPGCHLPGLRASQLRTVGDLDLGYVKFTEDGEVDLQSAVIGGTIALRGAVLSNPGGRALWADRLAVGNNMLCGGFAALGEVQLRGARIEGLLDLRGASLSNPGGCALRAERLTVGHNMACKGGFTAAGEVRLHGAHIGGSLEMDGATLTNSDGSALTADAITVGQDMSCIDGFTAHGEVRLPRARIGGQFNLSDATLGNPGGDALYADTLTVDQSMICTDAFTANGEVCLIRASIGKALSLSGATLAGTLDLDSASVGTLFLLLGSPPAGAVDLTNARIEALEDDPATWPEEILLRGCVYGSLENDSVSVRERLDWLGRQPGGFIPQTYDQLASVYRRAGDERAARKVAVAKQWRSRSQWNPLNWLLYATVGYGYRNWLAGVWLAVLAALGTGVFSSERMTALTAHPPAFHPVIYTLDILLPIVDLGQQSAWEPHGAGLYWSWFLIGAGWVLTTAVIAGLAGLLQRDSPRL